MPDSTSIPTLVLLLYGDHAPIVLLDPPPRLLLWARLFDEWLSEYKRSGNIPLYRVSRLAWRHLLELLKAPPYAITSGDIERYRDALIGRGLAASSVSFYMHQVSLFYDWCSRRSSDPESCGPPFNPVVGVQAPHVVPYASARLLDPGEALALLDVLKAEDALLSRRDYAFLLSRLRLGVTNKLLRSLKWGQIQLRADRAWVEWSPALPASPLPDEVWQAIFGYLEASGRVGARRPEGMPADAYIFAPLARSFGRGATGRAEEWDERRCLNTHTIRQTLKIYGDLLGIDPLKLTLHNLRHTAVQAFSETVHPQVGLQAFLVAGRRKSARRYQNYLEKVRQSQPVCDVEIKLPATLRTRVPHTFTAQSEFKHGLYSSRLPQDQVEAILKEGLLGIEDEREGLEVLMNGVMDWLARVDGDIKATMLLSEAHLLNTPNLVKMYDFVNQPSDGLTPDDLEVVKLIQDLSSELGLHGGSIPSIEYILACAAEDMQDDPNREKRLALSIARDRLILRNLKKVALETDDPTHYANLVLKYGRGCMRLCSLLKQARPEPGRLLAWLNWCIDRAIPEILEM